MLQDCALDKKASNQARPRGHLPRKAKWGRGRLLSVLDTFSCSICNHLSNRIHCLRRAESLISQTL